ncbi:hypothetical protein DWB77_04129 [Streptomyces hundungensis]|uniref:Uncharacterized protein n=1 Tax=Streptomyces hundungensis TaxID=1077946 RepID=A0A387HH23_9ACTN|nr:hypothetical protein DWB77_04129 [Streptomyces hundungensis]
MGSAKHTCGGWVTEVPSEARDGGRSLIARGPRCVVSHLRGNHEVRGAHSFFTQLDGVSIPSGATRFKRSTTGVKEGARPGVTDRAPTGGARGGIGCPVSAATARRPPPVALDDPPPGPSGRVGPSGSLSSNRSLPLPRTRSRRRRRSGCRPRRSARRRRSARGRPRGRGGRRFRFRTTRSIRPIRRPTSWTFPRTTPRPVAGATPGRGARAHAVACAPPVRPRHPARSVPGSPPRSRCPSPTVLPWCGSPVGPRGRGMPLATRRQSTLEQLQRLPAGWPS